MTSLTTSPFATRHSSLVTCYETTPFLDHAAGLCAGDHAGRLGDARLLRPGLRRRLAAGRPAREYAERPAPLHQRAWRLLCRARRLVERRRSAPGRRAVCRADELSRLRADRRQRPDRG